MSPKEFHNSYDPKPRFICSSGYILRYIDTLFTKWNLESAGSFRIAGVSVMTTGTGLFRAAAFGSIAAIQIAFVGAAAADTITVVSATADGNATPTTPFTLLNLGTTTLPCFPCGPGNGNEFQSSATITNPGGDISSISFGSGNPTSGLYSGNGSGFDSPYGQSNGTTNYLVAGGNNGGLGSPGTVTITYATPQTALDLIWGTADNNPQNVISISVDGITISGTNILSAAAAQGFGTINSGADDIVVEITGLGPFTTAVFSDNASPSFEFAPGVGTISATPVPAALPLFATGLGAMGLIGWRRKRKNAAITA